MLGGCRNQIILDSYSRLVALIVNEPGFQKCIYQRGKRSRVAKKKNIQPTYRAMRISSLICPQTCIWRNVLERLNRNYKNDSNARSRRVPDWFVPSDEKTAEKDNVDNFNDDTDISVGIHIGNDMNSSTLHHFDALSILLRLWPHDVQTPRCTDARQHSIDDLNLQCWRFISIK